MGEKVSAARDAADSAKLRQLLGAPELAWLVQRIRARLERGEPLDGTLTLVGATPQQSRAVARLLGHNPGGGTSLSVSLPELASRLGKLSAAPDLATAVEAIAGPVRDLAAERASGLELWNQALASARSSRLSRLAWYREWLSGISRDGTVTRLIRDDHADVVGQAAAVLERLPDDTAEGSVVLSALAAAPTDDERALNDGPLPTLVLSALAAREGVARPATPDAERALWSAAGVVSDDLASQVLVLNMRAGGEPLGRWMTEAAEVGQPFRATLRQLIAAPVLPFALDIYVCSSTAVMRAAADELGTRCPALVCTEGEPSVACARLLLAAVTSGSSVFWHADFSWPGLRGTATAIRRLQAKPWLMSAADYQAALAAGTRPLTGRAEPSGWDRELAAVMRMTGKAVGEERLVPQLVGALGDRATQLHLGGA